VDVGWTEVQGVQLDRGVVGHPHQGGIVVEDGVLLGVLFDLRVVPAGQPSRASGWEPLAWMVGVREISRVQDLMPVLVVNGAGRGQASRMERDRRCQIA
jgi:hypothetical protein